jgi:hypothetical protein
MEINRASLPAAGRLGEIRTWYIHPPQYSKLEIKKISYFVFPILYLPACRSQGTWYIVY